MSETPTTPAPEPSILASPAPEIPPAPVSPEAQLYPEGGAPAAPAPTEAAPAAPAPAEPDKSVVEGAVPPLTLESYKIELPETVKVDEGLLTEFRQAALDAKVEPAAAQKFAELYAKALGTQMEALVQQHKDNQAAWLAEIDKDPNFQGERRTQSLAVLGMAMKEYGSEEAARILNESGVGNHPAIVKYIYNLANGLYEGTPAPAGNPVIPANVGRKTAGQLFFPSMKQ